MTLIYPLLLLTVFIINVIPAFMPPTWTVLAFFYIHYHLAFIPTVIIGVIGATAGRIVLALMARYIFKPLLPAKWFSNYDALGKYFEKHERLTIPVVLGYAFSPISSNGLFIVAGFSNINLRIIAMSFFIGRLISYSFWILASHRISEEFQGVFKLHGGRGEIIGLALSLAVVILIGRIKWEKILK